MSAILLTTFMITSLLFCYFELLTKKTPPVVYWILTITFAVICATRSTITQDTIPYIDAFNSVSTNYLYKSAQDTPQGFELGYTVVMQISKIIFGDSYKVFFFIVVIINYFLLYIAYKKLCKIINVRGQLLITLFCLYTSYFGIYYNGIVLRAGLAISLLICASALLLDKKYILAFCMLWLSIKMHDSAILGILPIAILLFKINFSKISYRILLIVLLIIHVFQLNISFMYKILPSMTSFVMTHNSMQVFRSYLLNFSITEGISLKLIFFILIGYMFTIFKIDTDELTFKKYVNVYYFGLLIAVIFSGLDVFSRISDFCLVFYTIIMVLYLSKSKLSKDKIVIIVSTITMCNFILIMKIINLTLY